MDVVCVPAGARTQRDKLMEMPPRNCRFGRDIGIPVRGRGGWGEGCMSGRRHVQPQLGKGGGGA